MRAGRYPPPRGYIAAGGEFPDGPWVPDTPPYATVTGQVAAALTAAINQRGVSLRSVARAAGVSHATVMNLLAGAVVPDIGTVTALEHALNTPLYPPYRAPQPDVDRH